MQVKNLILLANQPHEGIILAKIANEIMKIDREVKISIAFTDYYTFYFQKQFLNGFSSSFIGDVVTQEKIYKDWQSDENLQLYNQKYLDNWADSYCKFRSLEQLARTNQWLYGDENDRYLLKTSKEWKDKVLYDTIIWCEELVSIKRPSAFVSLGNATLPTNILFEIAREQSIPFLTISHTRLKNYWILRDDFAYGISQAKVSTIMKQYSDQSNKNLADQFIGEIVNKNEAIYPAESTNISSTFMKKKNSLVQSLFSELKSFLKGTYWRLFIHSRERPYKVKRVEQNLIHVSLDQLRYIVIYHLRLAGFKFCGKVNLPPVSYFLWALHARPESSVLVLGDGEDEIDKLFEAADQIPSGYFLFVKEHPIMIGRRNRGFYKKIKKHKQIILIDPFVSSSDLIKNSLGVIGISGTILLEAAFYDKPSCALGKPEFNEFLSENGSDKIGIFLNKVISNEYQSPRSKIKPYIAYLLSESIESNFLLGPKSDELMKVDTITHFAKKITELV